MFNASRQYRCAIIRGKAKQEIEDYLPAYGKILEEICPCPKDVFDYRFNTAFTRYLPTITSQIRKTLDNHRTEICGKLFGMYYLADDDMVYASERTRKFMEDSDQPAFFKDICYKMQFPDGIAKIQTLNDRISNRIQIRQFPFILTTLRLAESRKIAITEFEIGYYILNSLEVLQGNVTPNEVIDAIVADRSRGVTRTKDSLKIEGKAESYYWQHIREQLNYLELGNLIRRKDDNVIALNSREATAIDVFINNGYKLLFDAYKYDLSDDEQRKQFYFDWQVYYSRLSQYAGKFETPVAALIPADSTPASSGQDEPSGTETTIEIGDEGEEVVYKYEKQRVAAFNPRLANKVLALGKQKGLGYDIQSVVAEPGDNQEFVKYIEVKSTKRTTAPKLSDNTWVDTLNITRNEFVAARQHKEYYSIFRVYFTLSGIAVFVINNVYSKMDKELTITPMTYRVDFSSPAVDCDLNLRNEAASI